MLGLYRHETQVTSGNGGLKLSGLGSGASAKEGIMVGFDFFKANVGRVSASLKPGELFAKFQISFYADPADAVFKALGVD